MPIKTATDIFFILAFWAFDLTPDRCSGYHNHIADEGSMMFSVRFDSEVPEHYKCLMYAVFDDELQIDGQRKLYAQQRAPPP